MEIQLQRPNHDSLLAESRLRWTLYARGFYKHIVFYVLAGLGMMALAYFGLREGESYWGFLPAFGLSFILLSATYSLQLVRNKARFLNRTKAFIYRLNKLGGGAAITLTDTILTYKDAQSYTEIRWEAFSGYKLVNDFLLVLTENNTMGGFGLQKQEFSPEQFRELISFVAGKIPAQ